MPAPQPVAAPETPAAPPPPETIADVLASDDLAQFRDEPAEELIPPQPKLKVAGKKNAKKAAPTEAESDCDESDDEELEPTKPDGEAPPKPKLPSNEEAEEAAFSEEALSTPEGVAAAREIIRASREATEKRNHILDRYDMRIKRKDENVKQREATLEQRSQQVEGVAQAITRDLRIFREQGMTAKEKLAALSRLAGGRPGHEILDELTAGILSDGKELPTDPRTRELERRLAESEQRWESYLQQQQAQQIEQQTAAQKSQIARVYTQIQEEAADAETYPEIASGIAEGDWTAEEVAEMVAGATGIMVKHYQAKNERLDKSEALRILEARLARRRGGERAPQGAAVAGTTKRPGSPARGAGRGTTITPSVADRSAGSVRELTTREERLADLQRDPAALKMLFPMLG